MKKSILSIMACFLLFAAPSFAVEEAQSLPNTPAESYDRSTPIAIEHEGNDSIGSALALKLKEHFNGSNLFKLEEKDTPKFRILISTVPEFEDRPGVGSAYALVWVFSQSEATLRHFISREVGVLTESDINAVATKIIEKTDGLAVRYSYLFPSKK